MKKYLISQIVEIPAENEDNAWDIFNQISRDDWEIKELTEKEAMVEGILNRQRERFKTYNIKELSGIESEMDNDEISH